MLLMDTTPTNVRVDMETFLIKGRQWTFEIIESHPKDSPSLVRIITGCHTFPRSLPVSSTTHAV